MKRSGRGVCKGVGLENEKAVAAERFRLDDMRGTWIRTAGGDNIDDADEEDAADAGGLDKDAMFEGIASLVDGAMVDEFIDCFAWLLLRSMHECSWLWQEQICIHLSGRLDGPWTHISAEK